MKHFIALLTTICLLLLACPINFVAEADVSKAEDVLRYIVVDDGTACICGIKSGVKCPSELNIPRKINGYLVSRINPNAFYNRKELKSITIPFGVTSIGDSAFLGCDGLTSIIIPNSVTGIGKNAFAFCSGLTSLTLPDSVSNSDLWYEDSFYGIGDDSFFHCPIKELIIANGSSIVTPEMVVCKDTVEKIIIPNSVISISDGAFQWCTRLTSIEIPTSVTSISGGAFFHCPELTSIEIPDSVTSIGNCAFYYCSGLTNIEIPDSVISIGESAFAFCSGLTSIEIPNSVTSIGSNAFQWCTGLTSVTIPDSVKYCNDMFFNCQIKELIIAKGSKSVTSAIVASKDSIEKVIIPDSVTSIGPGAFSGCAKLTSITIPDGIQQIGHDAFVNTGIYLDANNWEDGTLYISGYLIDVDITLSGDFFVKTGTKGIAEGAFEDCQKLTNITISGGVTYIDDFCGISLSYEDGNQLPLVITTNKGSRAEEYAKSHNIKVRYLDQPIAPELVHRQSNSVTLKYFDGYEYKMDIGEWQSSNVFTGLAPNSTHKFYQRIAETKTSYASKSSEALSVTTLKNTVEQPPLPEVLSKTSNSVTLKSTEGYEYSINGTVWQKSNVFTGLKENTLYTFFQRVAETETSYASYFSDGLKVWTDSAYIPGDLNGDEGISNKDAIYLLYHTFLPEKYPVNQNCDYNGDGVIDNKDAIYLLYYTFLPDKYPLK